MNRSLDGGLRQRSSVLRSVVSPANLLQEGRCGKASAGRRGELNEDLRSLVGFLIWIEVGGSPPISLASWLQVSVSRA